MIDKNLLYPNENIRTICYVANLPKHNNVEIGDYTYYSDNHNSPESFYEHIVHHYEFIGDRLIIGKFCAIAEGVKFIMNGANHCMNGITTYPFYIFGNYNDELTPKLSQLSYKGDMIIGNDVWIGENVTIMPGVKIGDGAIIGANSTVAKNVEPYSVVVGNPAKCVKKRFDDDTIKRLIDLKWWDWSEEKIFANMDKLMYGRSLEEFI